MKPCSVGHAGKEGIKIHTVTWGDRPFRRARHLTGDIWKGSEDSVTHGHVTKDDVIMKWLPAPPTQYSKDFYKFIGDHQKLRRHVNGLLLMRHVAER